MSVRSALPWPFRWVVLAMVFGFCSAVGLWVFEFGRDIAGLDRGIKEQLLQARSEIEILRGQIDLLKTERDQAQSVANTVGTVLTTEKVARDRLTELNKQLASENQGLKDDLGFFEQLIPSSGAATQSLAIRGLQAQLLTSGEIKWQVLVIQAAKNPVEFDGQLELVFSGYAKGRPWTGSPPGGFVAIKVKQYGRVDGVYQPPADLVVKTMTAKLYQGQIVRTLQAVKVL